MGRVPKVSTEIWSHLMEATLAYRSLAPWAWMDDSQVFGVVDPVTRQPLYCCVFGAAREIYGLIAFREQGYAVYKKMQKLGGPPADPDIGLEQDALFSEFTTEDELEAPDLEVLKELRLTFRGGGFPRFRSYRPELVPWFLDAAECEALTQCHRIAIQVARQTRRDPDYLFSPDDPQAIRTFFESGGEWKNQWRRPQLPTESAVIPAMLDELSAAAIKKTASHTGGIWEMATFFMPGSVDGEDRPYVPRMTLIVDKASGYVTSAGVEGGIHSFGEDWLEAGRFVLLGSIKATHVLPTQLNVRDKKLRSYLAPTCRALGITIKTVRSLGTVNKARSELTEHMQKGPWLCAVDEKERIP